MMKFRIMSSVRSLGSLPYFVSGTVVKGFGRGSKDLGIQTANFPEDVVDKLPKAFECGIYFGWASLDHGPVYKMVMSVGWNPFYRNEKKSMETHIIHNFSQDFYGSEMSIAILGYLRPEKSFNSLEELVTAIKQDIQDACVALEKPEFAVVKTHPHFKGKTNG